MPLSEHEQRLLDQMEQALASEDPRFISAFTGTRNRPAAPKNLGLSVVAVLVGVVLMLGGVVAAQPALGIVGFVVIVAGIAAAVAAIGNRADKSEGATASPKQTRTNFMQGLEERWDRRNDGM
jgi:hypothetical protein